MSYILRAALLVIISFAAGFLASSLLSPTFMITEAEDKNIDLYPDVFVGRIPCRNKFEVKTMIDKIIKYESSTYGEEWFNRIIVGAGDTYPKLDGNEGEENTIKVLENMSEFEKIKLWTSDGTLTGVKDIINAMNKGCGFVYFDGHSNPFRWSTHPPTTHIGNLSSFDKKDMLITERPSIHVFLSPGG